jgi:VWFA-related protein
MGTTALTAVLVGSVLAQAPAPSPGPAFPASTDAVTVDVVVLDKSGQPVSGLGREDFTVAEDGTAQTVTAFDAIQAPGRVASVPAAVPVEVVRPAVSSNARPVRPTRTIVIVFDDAHITLARGDLARKAVARYLTADGQPGDRVTLAATSGGNWWTATLPEGAPDLVAAMARLRGLRPHNASASQISDYEALRISRYRDEKVRNEVFTRLMELSQIADSQTTTDAAPGRSMVEMMAQQALAAAEARMKVTLALLDRVLASLAAERGRKTVLLVSEGFVSDPQLPDFARVARQAAEANTEIDFLDARGLDSDLPAMADAEIGLIANDTKALNILQRARLETEGAESVALDSGGLVLRGGNNLEGALRRSTDESRAYYLLGYQSTNRARDGKFRRIKVTVTRPGLTVRARKGYYAPRAEGELAPSKTPTIDPDVQRALDAPEPSADIPMRLAAFRLAPAGADGKTKVRLTAELDPSYLAFRPDGDRSRDEIGTFFVVASRDTAGGESHRSSLDLNLPADALAHLRATWLPLQRDFELAPGVYQAKLAVRDANAGRVASVVHEFEVPAATGLGFTTPVLTDTVIAPAKAGEPARPALVARRTFAAGSRLYCQFEVTGATVAAGAAASVRAGHELRRLDGTVLAHLDPTPMPAGPDGRVTRLLAISLRDARPGEHELVLTAHDDTSGQDVETRERFLVATPAEAAALGAIVLVAAPAPPTAPGVAPGPVALPAVPKDVSGYRSLVQRYGAGGREPAALDLAAWPAARLKDAARAMEAVLTEEVTDAAGHHVRRIRVDPESQTAAVDSALLLTEAAFLRVGDEEDALEAARHLLDLAGDSGEARTRMRRWALLVSSHFLDQSRLEFARRWAEEARRLDGTDPAALLALGIVSEMEATLGDARHPLRPVSARRREATPAGSESLPAFLGQAERERKAREAEDLFAAAIAKEPSRAEARLRHGRLLARRGRVAEASQDLEWVVVHGQDVQMRAVAHLLLARQDDARGETDAALRHYAAAWELAPHSLSASVGRSELLSRSGRQREAAQVVTGALSSSSSGGETIDPWLAYHLGFRAATADGLASLRIGGRP